MFLCVRNSPASLPRLVLSDHAGRVVQSWIEPLLHLHVETVHVNQRHHSLLPVVHEWSNGIYVQWWGR